MQPYIAEDARLALRASARCCAPTASSSFALALVPAMGIAGWLNFAMLKRPMAEPTDLVALLKEH